MKTFRVIGMVLGGTALALAWLLLVPEAAAAWGPGTHVALGELLLNALYLLPPAVRLILERFPIHFLYGSVAADISFAKKYAPAGRHSHSWKVGEELLRAASSDPLRATAYGYLAHLAADTVAHNTFVPRKLFLTPTARAHGHTYWEHRVDHLLGDEFLGKARRLVTNYDHTEEDELFQRVLSRTLFSFRTNRRLFRGMIRAQDDERWKTLFDTMLRFSRYDLPLEKADRYLGFSFDFMVEYLVHGPESRPRKLDPVGSLNLRIAKKLRRAGMAEGGGQNPAFLEELADRFFPFPSGPLLFWPMAKAAARRDLLSGRSGAEDLAGLPSRVRGRRRGKER